MWSPSIFRSTRTRAPGRRAIATGCWSRSLGSHDPLMKWITDIHKIHRMDIRQLDLNLLVAFHAMSEHRSVTRAAEAIGLSQPAMSAALSRLRLLFNDALF